MLVGVGVHQSSGVMSVVELVRTSIMVPGLAQNKDVITAAKGIGVDGNRTKVDIGIVPWCLTSR